MHGNVRECCWDWYEGRYYGQSPGADPPGSSQGKDRVIRGGGWHYTPRFCRSAFREVLVALPGIGLTIARRIIEVRPYRTVDDLLRVKGIGKKRLAQIRPSATAR